MFNVEKFLHSDSLSPVMEWKGYPKYNFIGGHNDSESIPIKSLKESIEKIILREGKTSLNMVLKVVHKVICH